MGSLLKRKHSGCMPISFVVGLLSVQLSVTVEELAEFMAKMFYTLTDSD